MHYYEQPAFIDNTYIELTSDNNVISYDQYLKENVNEVVYSTTSPEQHEAMIMSVIDEIPLILEKGSYIPWESRFRRFLDNKLEDRERMWRSIQKGNVERIKRLMYGSEVTTHVRHSQLMDEFDKFATKEGESLESVYERLTTLVNIMDRNNVRPISVSINTKFLNCLQPECSKYVTMVRHNQTGHTVSYDHLYVSLVKFEPHIQASKAKRAARNHDPLALIAHSNASL
ncbi:hypothetical protein Tco_0265315 [Tanacetum coccineum]